jgi:cytoskeletal protein RodZ
MARGNFGERLKREREMREVSLNEVTVATRISVRFLQALENEDWDKLPGGVFNRGFVRSIARYLGLDEESLLAEYDVAHGPMVLEAPKPQENRIPAPSKWLIAASIFSVLLVLAGVIAGGIYGWRRFSAHRRAKQNQAITAQPAGPTAPGPVPSGDPPASDSAPVTPRPDTPSTTRPLDLSVSTSAPTHVRVLGDGRTLLDADLPAGETRHFAANRQLRVTAADSSAVLLELNGQAMPPLGAPGASGTIVLSRKNLRQASGGNSQP